MARVGSDWCGGMARRHRLEAQLCYFLAFVVLLAPAACNGPVGATGVSEPCANAEECDRQTLGQLKLSTDTTETGFRSVITGPVGAAELSWSLSGDQTTFRYRPADGVLGPKVTINGTPADSAGASRAAVLLYSYDFAAHAAPAGKPDGQGALATTTRCRDPLAVR